jgi:lipid-binding SYLF domain-containing protein
MLRLLQDRLGRRESLAETDVTLRSEILSYSRSRGLLAGMSLEGSTIRPDDKANQHVYAKYLEAKAIVLSDQVRVPATAEQLVPALEATNRNFQALHWLRSCRSDANPLVAPLTSRDAR